MNPIPPPDDVQLIGTELAIRWKDGRESYLPLEFLRKACPCAACAGEPDVTGKVLRPKVSYTEASFHLVSWQRVGGYAWQPVWGDHHRSGLYSWNYLSSLVPPPSGTNV
jgi:DUF971 family protein